MIVRVLPASKGGIYSNSGSSSFLVNYLQHEAREEKEPDRAIFFNQQQEGITADEVQERIDANVQGLQKGKPHFHSLVISPSQDELHHLEEDPEKLKAYTRQVMDNYAANFGGKRQKTLTGDDLIWYATIHRSRHYSGLDEAVQTGEALPRQRKEGEQTHIHVIVSARDKTMSRSLHPDVGPGRFNYQSWLAKNGRDFEKTYGYNTVVTEAQHQKRLDKQLDRLDRAGLTLDRDRIQTVGQHNQYSARFWKGMGQVEKEVKQGNIFTANQAYERLHQATESKPKNSRSRVGEEPALQLSVPTDRQAEPPAPIRPTIVTEPNVATVGRKTTDGNAPDSKSASRSTATRTKQGQPTRPGHVNLAPLLNALRFESVPETGDQAQTQDDYQRRLKRRR